MKTIEFVKRILRYVRNNRSKFYTPKYRVVEIYKEDNDKFTVKMQIIRKNLIFYAKPEDILADDNIVDCLHPRDTRTLTYLGYLAINQPEYILLAQQMASNNSEVFVLKKRGDNYPVIKTAAEINQQLDIISKMSPKDAKVIGYAIATEKLNRVEKEKKEILENLGNKI